MSGSEIPHFHVFVDESGEFGRKANSSDHFLIAALVTENLKALEKRMKKEKAKLYNAGWPQDLEIKGTNIWSSPHLPAIPKAISDRREQIVVEIIEAIAASTGKLHYSIAKKKHLKPHLLAAEYGVAYNFLCGTLLCRAYPDHFKGALEVVVDQRSKETHHKMKFDGYLETRLVTECGHTHHVNIEHKESSQVLGLQAVDFLSWALFRHYEHEDSRFLKYVQPIVGYKDDWYSWKK